MTKHYTEWRKTESILTKIKNETRICTFSTLTQNKNKNKAKKLHWDSISLFRMAIIKKTKNNKCWQGCGEKKESLYTVRIAIMEVSMKFPQEIKTRTTIYTPGYISKEM
jgi:hypothetical protein